MSTNILQVKQPVSRVDDIISQQYHTYAPYSTTFGSNDEVRITIQSQDLYVLPSESYLNIEFTAAKDDGTAIGLADAFFTYGFISHLFSEIRYEINGVEIDRCKTPGITSLLKCMIACKTTDKMAHGLYVLNSLNPIQAKTYQMALPLRFVMGFFDDYNKVVLNSKHELILVRSRSNTNVYQANNDIVKFNITKIHWKVPHVMLSDHAKLNMMRTIARNDYLPLTFRSWDLYELPTVPITNRFIWNVKTTSQVSKPRYVVLAFQTNRDHVVANDASLFDHCNISNVKLYMNNERYPYDDMHLKFDELNYQELFYAFGKIQSSYYSGTSTLNPIDVTYENFINRPVFVFDCSRTDESIKSGMVDVRIEIDTSRNIPANTKAFCLIIHDNLIKYSPFTSLVHREI